MRHVPCDEQVVQPEAVVLYAASKPSPGIEFGSRSECGWIVVELNVMATL